MIKIYALNIAGLTENDIAPCRSYISADRLKRASRFRFAADRIRCITAEALVRNILETEYGMNRESIRIICDENGRPSLFVSSPERTGPVPDFNITHSGDWVICSVGTERSGIDVEMLTSAKESLAKGVLTPAEFSLWKHLPSDARSSAFTQYWTLKESYAKYRGLGLKLSFPNIETIPFDESTRFIKGDPYVKLFSVPWDNCYSLSVCVPYDAEICPEIVHVLCGQGDFSL